MYTGDQCPPCARWKSEEKSKVEAAGYKVEITTSLPPGVTRIPTFRIVDGNGNQIGTDHVGFTPASTLLLLIKDSENPQLASKRQRWTQKELRDQLAKHGYSASTRVFTRATVAAGTNVYDHLRNEHQFSIDQISGLRLWEANSLHDAVHPDDEDGPPLITPFRN
jgi:hypothetical protein